MITKESIQREFDVSYATVNNWIKTELIPDTQPNGLYSEETFAHIKKKIENHGTKLKSRANRNRNRSRSVHHETLDQQESINFLELILNIHKKNTESSVESMVIAVSVFLLESSKIIHIEGNSVKTPLDDTNSILFRRFISDWILSVEPHSLWNLYNEIKVLNISVDEIDFVGTVYQSLRSVAEKSDYGSYFTPSALLSGIQIKNTDRVIDPCCGSGRIILSLISRNHNPDMIFARDIDELALKICRVNFVLFFKSASITHHIEKKDFISENLFTNINLFSLHSKSEPEKFDVIVTNPPWGAKFSPAEKSNLLNQYNELKTTESFSITLFNAINMAGSNGRLHFILPESILSVDTHSSIREYVFNGSGQQVITRFGNAFKGVMSKVIRLDLFKSESTGKIIMSYGSGNVEIPKEIIPQESYQIPIVKNETEIRILKKILNCKYSTVKGKCQFGLGVVTGNNSENLFDSPMKDAEPIYKGKDIEPFVFKSPSSYIVFNPEKMQQVAPVELYRQKKICYRFISDRIIMAVDNNSSLLLNSANFFIPDTGLPLEVIATVFNSSIFTFIYRRIYNSTKVLRSHLENFPIPKLTETDITELQHIQSRAIKGENIICELDQFVGRLFTLTPEEIVYIERNL